MIVPIRCICPPKNDEIRHPEGDTVVLRDTLGFKGAHAVRWAVALLKNEDPNAGGPQVLALLSEQYLLEGVIDWSLRQDETVSDNGHRKIVDVPIDVTTAAIRDVLLTQLDVASEIADKADDLYGPVILPLVLGASPSSRPMPTDESTSPTKASSEKPPKPSKRSSITTIPTAATETTSSSLDGVSNSSQSSVSAA